MASRKLQRQLKRAFGTPELDHLVAEARAALKAGTELSTEERRRLEFLNELPTFLENIDTSYAENEDRLALASRNIDISSAELGRAREAVTAMVDALTEGYLVVNQNGICEGFYSRVSTEIFGVVPANRSFFDLLRLTGEDRETAVGWLRLAFENRLGIKEISDLGPREFTSASGRSYRLSYSLVKDAVKVNGLVVIAADVTQEIEAKRLADARVEEAKLITKLAEDRESFLSFARLANEILAKLADETDPSADVRAQFRFDLHTLKGGAATFFLHDLEHTIHAAELEMKNTPDLASARVHELGRSVASALDDVFVRHRRILGAEAQDRFGLTREALLELVALGLKQEVPESYLELLLGAAASVDVGQPLKSFRSTVKVEAERLAKRVQLVIDGRDARVAMGQYRRVFAALVHLFRNAVDHGIETPEERERAGKPAVATITASYGGPTAEHLGWWLSIRDDGRGVDVDALRARYRAAGVENVNRMTDGDLLALLLERGISTKADVTTTSGMGVGLGAIGQAVREVGGTWRIETRMGEETTFHFQFPMPEYLSEVKAELGIEGPTLRGNDIDLNRRYNDLISEVAEMIRSSRERERVDQEIQMARAVQKTLLPVGDIRYGEFFISGRSYVAGSCGGDWWYHARSGEHVVLWIGDVLGHGVASALVASACRATAGVLHSVTPDVKIEEYLNVVSDVIYSMTAGEIYVTAACMRVNLRTGEAEYANASHPAAMVLGDQQPTKLITHPLAPPLGLQARQSYHSERFTIEPGQGVFLMTDGLLDLQVRPGTRWSLPRLMKLLQSAEGGVRAHEMIKAVEAFMFERAEGALPDDTTYVALHRANLGAGKRAA